MSFIMHANCFSETCYRLLIVTDRCNLALSSNAQKTVRSRARNLDIDKLRLISTHLCVVPTHLLHGSNHPRRISSYAIKKPRKGTPNSRIRRIQTHAQTGVGEEWLYRLYGRQREGGRGNR